MSLRSPAEHEDAELRHAGMDSRHNQVRKVPPEHPCQPGFQHSMLE